MLAPIGAQLVRMIAEGGLELPVLPAAVAQIISATRDDGCGAHKLTEIIRRDAALTAHLFRVASSPHYASAVKLVSLQQAVARLGMATIREIALVISCQTRVFRVAGHEAAVNAMFRHALASGLLAQEIARLRRWNVEEAFLLGLLHDVGRPILLQALVDIHRELHVPLDPLAMATAVAEHHALAGGALVKSWGFSDRLHQTVSHHHADSPPSECAKTVPLVRFAGDLAHHMLGGTIDEAAIRQHAMLVPLNLYPDELDRLLAQRDKITAAVEAIA